MLSRPLDALELSAIDRYLEQHSPTRCPPTGRGELPHLPSDPWVEAIRRWHTSRCSHSEQLLSKGHNFASAGSESRRDGKIGRAHV